MNNPTPRRLNVYHVFVASPDDMREARSVVRSIFAELNRGAAANSLVHFELLEGADNVTIGAGRPQGLIVEQVLEQHEASLVLIIGIMGQTFGSPTGTHGSGTEEELTWGLERWREKKRPEIKIFFKKVEQFQAKSAEPERIRAEIEQWEKVLEFKTRVRGTSPQVYWKEFVDLESFKEILRIDVNNWFSRAIRVLGSTEIAENVAVGASNTQIGRQGDLRVYSRTVIQEHPPIGRDSERETCISLLKDNRVLLLYGPPGQGKTALARFVARSCESEFQDGLYEVDLQNEKQLDNVSKQIGAALGDTGTPDALALLTQRKVLIVLDSFELLLKTASRDRIRQFFDMLVHALCSGSRVIVTSQERFEKAGIASLEVGRLGRDHAIQLFHEESRQHYSEVEGGLLEAFVNETLGGHPLSIKIVARYGYYAARSDIRTLIRLWNEKWGAIGNFDPGLDDKPLTTAFELSYSILKDESKALFLALSLLPDGIDLELVIAIWGSNETAAYDALGDLAERCLVEGEGPNRKLLSPIFRYAQEKLATLQMSGDAIHATVSALARQIDTYYDKFVSSNAPQKTHVDPRERNSLIRLHFHNIHASLDRRLDPSTNPESYSAAESVLSLYWAYHNNLSGYKNAITSADDAVRYLEKASAIYKINDKLDKATECRYYVGNILWLRGDLEKARPALKEVLESESATSAIRADCRRAFAHIEYKIGNLADAAEQYELIAAEAASIGDRECVVRCKIGLIDAYRKLEKFDDAMRCVEDLHDDMSQLPLSIQGNIVRGNAYVLLERGDLAEAEENYCRALEIFQSVSPFGQAHCQRGLGEVYLRQGKYVEAESCFDKALKLYDDARKNPSLGWGLVKLGRGRLAIAQSNPTGALEYYRDAIALFDRQNLNEPFEQAVAYAEVGKTLKNLDRSEEALGNFRLAKKIFDKTGAQKQSARIATLIGEVEI